MTKAARKKTISADDKRISEAFGRLEEVVLQKNEILGIVDSRVRAGMLGIVLNDLAAAQLALVEVLRGEIYMAHRQTLRGDPLPGEDA